MISFSRKKTQKKFFLLFAIAFFHIIGIVMSSCNDRALHDRHFFPEGEIKFNDWKYWLWFFTWYSAWTSLITIPWTVYKIFSLYKKKNNYNNYSEQLTDLIVTQANLISGVIFCFGGFMLGKPHRPMATYPILGNVKPIYVWVFFNIFWHVLAPGTVFYYFRKYCQINKLLKKKLTFIGYSFNQVFYTFYVLIRPEIKMINYHSKLRGPRPYNYPSDYPYAPFFWIMGKFSSKTEEKSENKGLFFWHNWPDWLKFLFWFSSTIVLTYVILIITFNFLIKIKIKQKSQN